jgi:putative ABC transport system permease protein
MSLWRQLTRGLRVLTNRTAADEDVTEEANHYLEEATAAFIVQGMSPDDARRAARLELGNMTNVTEQVRASGWENLVGTVFADLRYALRQLRSNFGFTAVAVLTLALGIGATTAIFSAVNPILFETLPYPQASRLMMIWYRAPNGTAVAETFGTYREFAERSRSFDALAVMKRWQPVMTGAAEPERFDGQSVSAGYFRVLGVSPALGQDFQASDDQLNGPKVVVLSDRLWRRRFGGDRAIVGRQIILEDKLHTIIGVMPGSFDNVLAPAAELWSPLQYDMSLGPAWGHHLRMVGRLRPGVSMNQAQRELDTIARTPVPEFARRPWTSLDHGSIVNLLQDDVTGAVKPVLLAILGAVVLMLVIACVNVTNILLAHGAQRRGEFAMRAALGAGRARLVRQLLTESLLLATLGGALGMVVAAFGVRALVVLSPASLPRAGAIILDSTVFVFALGITTLIGLVVGLVPALQASGSDPHAVLQQSSGHTAGSRGWTRRTLVVSEVALALVLLISAGLLLRSLGRWFAVDPGFDASHLLTMQVHTFGHRFDKNTTDRFFAQALERVRQVPGVTAASFTSQLPLSGDDDEYGARFEGDDPNTGYNVFRYAVSPGYFESVHIPLRRGRALDEHDIAGAPLAVVISESLARAKFPDQDPVGRRVHIGPTNQPWYTIVGVVGDVRQMSLAKSELAAVYITPTQSWFVDDTLSLVVRARGDTAALAPAVRNAIWSVDRDPGIVRVATMDDLLAALAAERHFALVLFETFGLAALVLAAIGIYGILSGSVTERMREIGVRSALGASRGNILALIVRQGMTLTVVGAVIGLVGAVIASQALITLLFGISRLDPVTYLGMIALLLGVSVVACWVPAWRAARVDPAITLRAE